jgi:hypothetical protein
MKFISTPRQLKDDAIARGYKPGALVRPIFRPEPVLLTSWPWFEGEGDDQHALIMGRMDPADPATNQEMRYFTLVAKVGEADL